MESLSIFASSRFFSVVGFISGSISDLLILKDASTPKRGEDLGTLSPSVI